MMAELWLPLLIKAGATALLVVAASVIAEALGPLWGALIASLPVATGPAYVFLALQHEPAFVATSALGSFAGNAATAVFLIAYGLPARTTSLAPSLGVALLAWLLTSLALQQITWTPLTAALLNLAIFGLGFLTLRATPSRPEAPSCTLTRRWFELPLRALAVAAFVTLIVAASTLLGPKATGIATVFPISLLCLIVILQPRLGGPATALLAANALRSMLGFGAMLLVLHLAIPAWGVWPAMLVALLVSLGWSASLLLLPKPA